MPSVFRTSDGGAIIYLTPAEFDPAKAAFDSAWDKVFNRATGTEDAPGRNQPLAPRKPSGGRTKGHAAKGVKQARKGAGAKRGR